MYEITESSLVDANTKILNHQIIFLDQEEVSASFFFSLFKIFIEKKVKLTKYYKRYNISAL